MRESLGLLRAGWLTALSYRVNLIFSLVGLATAMIPLYFVAQALQPVAAASIEQEGGHYFGFLVVGLGTFTLVSTALLALPNALTGAIASGTLEAMLATPARIPAILLGLVSYDFSWSAIRVTLLLLVSVGLGSGLMLAGIPIASVALLLTLACYFGLALGLAAMILVYRTIGPLGTGLLTASALLGGVYYSTSVIPSWIQQLSIAVPLTYGLRVMRQALLGGASISAVRTDLTALAALSILLLVGGAAAFRYGLNYARREGSLGQY